MNIRKIEVISRSRALIVGVTLMSASAFASERSGDDIPVVSFAQFPYPITATYVIAFPGTSSNKTQMDTPGPQDFPPGVRIVQEDARTYPSIPKHGPAVYMLPRAHNILNVYNITAVKSAPYKTIQVHIEHLRRLLETRPSKVANGMGGDENYEQLPDYPPRNAAHNFQLKLVYIDAEWGSGLFYITQFVQDAVIPSNDDLVYEFQGITKDSKSYVAADFRITHRLLQTLRAKDNSSDAANQATERAAAELSKASDDSYTPSLKKIRAWVSTLKID